MPIRRDDWSTPLWLFQRLNREFGPFDLDAAANSHNHKCPQYLTDALPQDWPGTRIWMNPPYGAVCAEFVRKAYEQSELGKLVICLLPARTETEWFHDYVIPHASEIRFLRNRVAFVPPPGLEVSHRGNRPVHNSCVVVFNGKGAGKVTSMRGVRNSQILAAGQQELALCKTEGKDD